MRNKIEVLKDLLKEMNYQSMMEIEDCIWYRDEDNFYWNTDNNERDLLNGDGNTYSGYQTEGLGEFEGHVVVNLDTQQGYWITKLFDLSKEVKDVA